MDRREKIPEYNITDDILSKAACIVEKIQGLSVLNGGSVGGGENRERLLGEQNELSGAETDSLIYRQKGTGVFAGEHLLCRAPMPQYVEELMGELNDWLEQSKAHPLIKAGIVLYQYVMVQFYEDNNTCFGIKRAEKLLEQWKPGLRGLELSPFLAQDGFVRALEQSDLHGEAGPFLNYFLASVELALGAFSSEEKAPGRSFSVEMDLRVKRLLESMGNEAYTTRALMERLELKHRPTFRDNYLLPAMRMGVVEMTIPDKPNSSNQRYRKCIV